MIKVIEAKDINALALALKDSNFLQILFCSETKAIVITPDVVEKASFITVREGKKTRKFKNGVELEAIER